MKQAALIALKMIGILLLPFLIVYMFLSMLFLPIYIG